MISRMDERLKQQGYHFVKTEQQEVGIYYKYVDGVAQVIMGLYAHPEFRMEQSELGELQQRLRELFLHPQGRLQEYPMDMAIYDVKLLTLIVTAQADTYSYLAKEGQNVWLYDTNEDRLIIYENQPDDFYGLKELLQAGTDRKAQRKEFPLITVVLAVVNTVVFLILACMGDTESATYMLERGALYPEMVVQNGEWYRLFTCTFLHFGAAHLGNNMLLLVLAGMHLERAMGKLRYTILYLLSGIGSSVLSLLWMIRSGEAAVSAGASGAIFGIIGALIWVAIRNKGRFEGLTTKGLVFMAALSLYYGFTSTGIDNWGHIGGLISGFILAILLYRKKQACTDTFHRVY